MSIASPLRRGRRVIPRWRPLKANAALKEERSLRGGRRLELDPCDLRQLDQSLETWGKSRSLGSALQLLESASFLQGYCQLVDAAELVLSSAPASVPARAMAASLLNRSAAELPFFQAGTAIREYRNRLARNPRNVIAAMNLAHAYCAIGRKDKAARAVDQALMYCDGNRTILRGAARFFLHIKEGDRAHRILARAPTLLHDPWLLSGEVALAEVVGRTSQNIGVARALAKSAEIAPLHRSELLASLGDLYTKRGDHKLAKRSYLTALQAPTENVVAQAQYLSTTGAVTSLPVKEAMDSLKEAPEARGFDALARGDWGEAQKQARLWLKDEPFSTRPVNLGFTAAEIGSRDMRAAESFAEAGFRANPGDPMQHNNFAFTLVHNGHLSRAEAVFASCRMVLARHEGHASDRAVFRATEGLLAFRVGDVDGGRRGYGDAAKFFESNGDSVRLSVALARWAAEEARIGYGDQAIALYSRALVVGLSEDRQLLKRLLEQLGEEIAPQRRPIVVD